MLLRLLPCACTDDHNYKKRSELIGVANYSIDDSEKQQRRKQSNYNYFDDAPTYDEICSWARSFDKLMKHIEGQKRLAEFLKSEFSDENILFWQACEELKREKNTEKVEEKARIIYEDFVSILSPKEVSLDSRVREIVNSNMQNPSTKTFDEAQEQIYTLMQRDSYPRFVNSAQFKQWLSSYDHVEDIN